jgi:hypothetical protein
MLEIYYLMFRKVKHLRSFFRTIHLQETYIHALGGILTRDPSKRVSADLRRRPRDHWDRRSSSSSSIGPRWLEPPEVLQPRWLIVRARLLKFSLTPPGAPTPTTTRETSSSERGKYGREMAGNFADKWRVTRHLKGSFT